jgi:hypothetical protein
LLFAPFYHLTGVVYFFDFGLSLAGLELLDAAGSVDGLLLVGIERMRSAGDLDV